MPGDYDPSDFNVPPGTAASSTVTAIPAFTAQQTTANLAAAASVDFDFNIDTQEWLDCFVFLDQAGIVRVFVRQSSTDTYRQLGADYAIVASTLTQPFTRLRTPGSQARVRLINNGGSATTVLSFQVHARSM